MCQTLSGLRAAVAALARRFDPALVPPAQLGQVVGDAGAIEKMMATIAALAAARMARTGPAATAPRQAARELAQASGTSVLEAARALEAARQLEAQPEVAAAARAGALSRPQLGLVAGAVAVNRAAAPELLALAESGSLGELAEGAARPGPPRWTWRPGGRPCTGPGACAPTPTPPAPPTCTPRAGPRTWPWSWPPSAPGPTTPSPRPGGRGAGNGPRPTPLTAWWPWPAAGAGAPRPGPGPVPGGLRGHVAGLPGRRRGVRGGRLRARQHPGRPGHAGLW